MKKFHKSLIIIDSSIDADLNTATFVRNILSSNDTNKIALMAVLQYAIILGYDLSILPGKAEFTDEDVENITLFVEQHINVQEFNSIFTSVLSVVTTVDSNVLDTLVDDCKKMNEGSTDDRS